LREGFTRHQLSVDHRYCPTLDNAEARVKGLREDVPDAAHLSFFFLTDKQYGMTRESIGIDAGKCRPGAPEQFDLF